MYLINLNGHFTLTKTWKFFYISQINSQDISYERFEFDENVVYLKKDFCSTKHMRYNRKMSFFFYYVFNGTDGPKNVIKDSFLYSKYFLKSVSPVKPCKVVQKQGSPIL